MTRIWISLACWAVVALGYDHFWVSLLFNKPWHAYTPRIGFTLLYVLAIAMGKYDTYPANDQE
jgi:palmitoyltransferase